MSNPSTDISQMLYLVQLLENQQKTISEQLIFTENQISGIALSKKTMEGLQNTKENHEIIIPIGTNAFTKATVLDPDKMIIPISSDILIEKNLEQSIEIMTRRLELNKKNYDNLVKNYNDISEQIQKLRSKLDDIYSKIKR
ncbi:MAG: prefoldin subunit alpha [Promethearchaeota archaeon]